MFARSRLCPALKTHSRPRSATRFTWFTLQHPQVLLQSLSFPCSSKKSKTHAPWVPCNTRSVTSAERACPRQRHLTAQRNRALSWCRHGCRALNLLTRSISSFVGVALSLAGEAPALASTLPVLLERLCWVQNVGCSPHPASRAQPPIARKPEVRPPPQPLQCRSASHSQSRVSCTRSLANTNQSQSLACSSKKSLTHSPWVQHRLLCVMREGLP